ncbi:gliding motility-associated C-terminal domain-containing protein [Flavobacterium columnare]|uniref:SprC n=1 Tax=Flavobacterium columnare TaxID=996 RepID=A0A2U8JY90_9FLAO|nr:gliding motility-associated C-terminal domain-containing protein [Flavobacterium columnare]AWK84776.1 SprC [Flavobacterium columnare]MEB3801422.1 gliding motility-associated C-terminal domain-containing protein [Flavobacterium columnare]
MNHTLFCNFFNKYFFTIFLFSFILENKAQTFVNAPSKNFGNICASSNFNSYSVNFDFNGFSPGNIFTLEMSDPEGDFAKLTPITILSSQLSTSPGKITFKVPENITTGGKSYRLRIRTSSPAMTSSPTLPFHAYFWIYNDKINILDDGSGNLSICGSNGILAISEKSPSPLQHKGLKYIWKKDGIVIPNETESKLNIAQSGKYSVQIDYGNCNSTVGFIAYSQEVNVAFTNNSVPYSITSSLGTTVCPSNPTTLSTTAGQTYQWYIDSQANGNFVKIDGATSYSLKTANPGVYKVVISPGTVCESTSTNTITLQSTNFNLAIDAKSVNYLKKSEIININATTTAINPTYEWFLPGGSTPTSTVANFTVTNDANFKEGLYKLVVKQNDPSCVYTKTIQFKIIEGVESVNIPNVISPNDGNNENDTWILPIEYKNDSIEVLILDSYGKEVFKMKNYDDSWPESVIEVKDINPIYYYIISKDGSPLKKGSLTVLK